MSKVTVYDQNGELLQERQLDRERIKIGRRADCDVRLDHLSVSGEHALITTIRNDSFLQDLGSTNGIRVNGKLVKNHHLQAGDEIGIAIFTIRFFFEAWVMPEPEWAPTVTRTLKQLATSAATRGDQTLFEVGADNGLGLTDEFSDRDGAASAAPVKESAVDAPPPECGFLRLLGGPGAGKQLQLAKTVLTLGKPGQLTSVIGKRGGRYFLTYVEGTRYPQVNGMEVGATPYELKDHDIIEMVGTRLEFFYR